MLLFAYLAQIVGVQRSCTRPAGPKQTSSGRAAAIKLRLRLTMLQFCTALGAAHVFLEKMFGQLSAFMLILIVRSMDRFFTYSAVLILYYTDIHQTSSSLLSLQEEQSLLMLIM